MSVVKSVVRSRLALPPSFGSVMDVDWRGPTLDLNFINGAPLGSRITFTRASTATYFDVTGVRQIAAINAPRLEFDPSTHAPRGLLIEEARTNSLLNSGAPATQTTASLVAGTYCLWVEGSGTATSSAGTAVGSGFGAATTGSPNVFTLTGAGTVVVTVSGSVTLFQLENGPFATSYIATVGAIATRAKDLASLPVGAWFNPVASTLVVDAMFPSGPVNTSQQYLAEISDGTTNNRLRILRNTTSNSIFSVVQVAGVTIANLLPGSIVPGAIFKVGHAIGAAGSVTTLNGVAGTSNTTTANLAAFTTLFIGTAGPGNVPANGYIRRVRYWPRMLSQGELNQVTL